MNYIEEDTAFERWCENNYLPILSQAIWKKLFKRFNRSGWSEWVTVDNLTLMADVQIRNEKTFIDYRDKLIEVGLIEYQKGKKGTPNKYKLISLVEKNTGNFPVHSTVNSTVETTVYSTVHSTDINKHKPNKTKQDDIVSIPVETKKADNINNTPPNPPNDKPKKNELTKKDFVQLMNASNFSQELKDACRTWLNYKWERNEPYKKTGFSGWLSKVDKTVNTYGDTIMIELIEMAVANGWQGITWDKAAIMANKGVSNTQYNNQPKSSNPFLEILQEEYGGNT